MKTAVVFTASTIVEHDGDDYIEKREQALAKIEAAGCEIGDIDYEGEDKEEM